MRAAKPSRTARKVALNIVTLGAKPGMDAVLPPGLVETTAELLAASGAVGVTTIGWCRSRTMVSVYEAFDWMMPGQFEAFAHRKAFFEHQVREGIGNGASQVLVLGAGYDTLAWRLAEEFRHVRFFETDHPATAGPKAKGIAKMGERENLFLLPEDLGKRRLEDVLGSHGSWNPAASTVFVAEGLLMYLPPPAPRELLAQCASLSGSRSRIAFSYIGAGEDGRPDAGPWTGLVLWLLKAGGEPWLWSIWPGHLGEFLAQSGWMYAPDLVGAMNKRGIEYLAVATK